MQRSASRRATTTAIGLLPRSSKPKLAALVVANMSVSLLDLTGIALIGVVGYLLVDVAQSQSGETQAGVVGDILAKTGWEPIQLLLIAGIAAVALLLLKSLLATLITFKTLTFLARTQAGLSSRLVHEVLQRPLAEIQRRTPQETAFALTAAVNAAILGLVGSSALALGEIALLVVVGAGLLLFNPLVMVAALVFFGLLGWFMHLVLGNWAARMGATIGRTTFALNAQTQEAIANYREATVLHRMTSFERGVAQGMRQQSQAIAVNTFIAQVPKYVYETGLLIGALALGGFQFLTQTPQEAVTTVAVFLAAASRIMPSMLRLQNDLVSIRSSAGQAQPAFDLFAWLQGTDHANSEALSVTRQTSAVLNNPSQPVSVTVRRVSARYPNSEVSSLHDVDLDARPGQMLAIVGPSGAGKSTLVDVILGVLPPSNGEALLDDMPPRLAFATWPGRFAYVPQRPSLQVGSIRSNVALGIDPAMIDDGLVWESLRRAHLDSYVRGLPGGLDTPMGEGGAQLSGGEMQRIALARALYEGPRLLVLDEATSALDTDTEHAVSQALTELKGSVTMIVVAHRLTTVRGADRVVYVDNGRILAQGPFATVRQQVPKFDESLTNLGM